MKTESEAHDWTSLVRGAVEQTRFGQVVITIHQGKVVQIERTEKTRLEASSAGTADVASAPASIRST